LQQVGIGVVMLPVVGLIELIAIGKAFGQCPLPPLFNIKVIFVFFTNQQIPNTG